MKPRIKIVNLYPFGRIWRCSGDGAIAFSLNPRGAFAQWQANLKFTRMIDLIEHKTGARL